jgi:hypothetical protein
MTTKLTEEQQADLWRMRAKWVGIYSLIVIDEMWQARRYAQHAQWLTANSPQELEPLIQADYQAATVHDPIF